MFLKPFDYRCFRHSGMLPESEHELLPHFILVQMSPCGMLSIWSGEDHLLCPVQAQVHDVVLGLVVDIVVTVHGW